MRYFLAFVLFLMFVNSSSAQLHNEESELFLSVFGRPKKEIVTQFVKVETTSNDQFVKLYDEYELKRKQLGQKRYTVLSKYVKNYSQLSEAETDEILQDIISLTTSQDKLISQYYRKFKKSLGTFVAAQFYQIEWYLQSEMKANLLENIPIISDLDRNIKK